MAGHRDVYQHRLDDDFDRPFELAMGYWLYNGFDISEHYDQYGDFNELLGEAPYKPHYKEVVVRRPETDFKFNYGTKLRYMAIAINTTIDPEKGFPIVKPVRDAWEEFAKKEVCIHP